MAAISKHKSGSDRFVPTAYHHPPKMLRDGRIAGLVKLRRSDDYGAHGR